jgi:hypothetical protein
MNKTEAAYVNTLLRWLLGDTAEVSDPEQARWVACQLADRAARVHSAALNGAAVERLWLERDPTPYALPALLAAMWEVDQQQLTAEDATAEVVEQLEGLLDSSRYVTARPPGSDGWDFTQLYEYARDHARVGYWGDDDQAAVVEPVGGASDRGNLWPPPPDPPADDLLGRLAASFGLAVDRPAPGGEPS